MADDHPPRRRAPHPCNCHRIHGQAGRRWGEAPWFAFFRVPPGLKPGDWCACMCPVHENPPEEEGERERLYHEATDREYEVLARICRGVALVETQYGLAVWTGEHGILHAIADEDSARRAANLLRTEPGGEAEFDEASGEGLPFDLYGNPNLRPTTPVEPGPPWQPMETAPKDGTGILVALDPDANLDHYPPLAFAAWLDGWYDLSTGEYGDWFEPTHWKPIPSAPVEEREPEDA